LTTGCIFLEEQAFMPDYSGNQNEWTHIVNAVQPPSYNADCVPLNDTHHTSQSGSGSPDWLRCGWLTLSERKRHIGIDQGVTNFVIVAVDKTPNALPVVVGGELYDLEQEGLNIKRFDMTDLILLLQTKTVLMSCMQHPAYTRTLPGVDRVIVHI